MRTRNPLFPNFALSLSFWLLVLLFAGLWLAGGSARGDVLGQPIVRFMSCTLLVVALVAGSRPSMAGVRFPVILLTVIALIPLVQLIPLPPGLWQSFAGRDLLAQSERLLDEPASWRPLSIAPGATLNALASLVVPVAVVAFALGLQPHERTSLVGLLLAVVVASTLFGLLQVSGGSFDNPLINDVAREVSGTFANRNHFALLVAIGCLLIPVWCFQKGARVGWRGPVALGLLILFVLTILASGSRTGMILAAIGVISGMLIARKQIESVLRRFPVWVRPVAIGLLVLTVFAFVLFSFTSDRAASINRVISQDIGADMRLRGLSTLMDIFRDHIWIGHGFGTFDQIFRIYEPDAVLQLQYFNQAHNDYLQIVSEGGVVALLVFVVAIGWWTVTSARIWRADPAGDSMLGRTGSVILLLILLASAVDYPARTPLIMAVTALAALWLSWGGSKGRQGPTLPVTPRHL